MFGFFSQSHLCAVNPGLWRQTVCFFWPAWWRSIWLRRAENGNIKVFVLLLSFTKSHKAYAWIACIKDQALSKQLLHLVKLAVYFVLTYFFFKNCCLSGTQCGAEAGTRPSYHGVKAGYGSEKSPAYHRADNSLFHTNISRKIHSGNV